MNVSECLTTLTNSFLQVGAYGQGTKPVSPQRFYDLSLRKNNVQTFWDKPSPELNKKLVIHFALTYHLEVEQSFLKAKVCL